MTEYLGRLVRFPRCREAVYRYYWWVWKSEDAPQPDHEWVSPYTHLGSYVTCGQSDIKLLARWQLRWALRSLRRGGSERGQVIAELRLGSASTIASAAPVSRRERRKMERDLRATIRELEASE